MMNKTEQRRYTLEPYQPTQKSSIPSHSRKASEGNPHNVNLNQAIFFPKQLEYQSIVNMRKIQRITDPVLRS